MSPALTFEADDSGKSEARTSEVAVLDVCAAFGWGSGVATGGVHTGWVHTNGVERDGVGRGREFIPAEDGATGGDVGEAIEATRRWLKQASLAETERNAFPSSARGSKIRQASSVKFRSLVKRGIRVTEHHLFVTKLRRV